MMELVQWFVLASESTGNFFSGITDYLSSLNLENLDVASLGVGGVAVVLAVVWFFVRLIRTLVSILFAICVLLVVLHFAGYIDLSSLWEQAAGLLQLFSEPAAPAAQ